MAPQVSSHIYGVRVFLLLIISSGWCTASAVNAQQNAPAGEQESKKKAAAATDSLGDPLPEGAKLRLGTSRFYHPSTVCDLALSPDETSVVTMGQELIVWDTRTGKERWRADENKVAFRHSGATYGNRIIAFSADSRKFYTPTRLNLIYVWDTLTGRREIVPLVRERDNQGRPFQGRAAQGNPLAIDVAPDGNNLALANANGIVVSDAAGKVLFEIENKPAGPLQMSDDRLAGFGHYSDVRFSPDKKVLAAVVSDSPKVIRIHDSNTGQERNRITLTAQLVRMTFSQDGKRIATTERDSSVRMYDTESGKQIWSHVVPLANPFENYTSAIAFSPDGEIVAACATDNVIRLFNPANGEEIGKLLGHHWYPWALAFTRDSKTLYSSGWDGAIRRWDIARREQLDLPMGIRATSVVAVAPHNKLVAFADDRGTIQLLDANQGTVNRTVKVPSVQWSKLAFSADSGRLAAGGSNVTEVHAAVWNVATGEQLHHWKWPKGRDPHSSIESLCFAKNGNRLAAAVFRQSKAFLWDLTDGHEIAQLQHGSIYGLSFSPDSETLATAGWDSKLRFWNAESGTARPEFDVKVNDEQGLDLRMYAVSYSDVGDLIATAHIEPIVRIWHADDMTLRKTIQVQGRFVFGALSFSPDGLWIATGSMNGDIELWDPMNGQKVHQIGKHEGHVYTLGFGEDPGTLVSGGEDGVGYVWDLRPRDKQPDQNIDQLWQDLRGEDSQAAYRAMWALSQTPEHTMSLLAEKMASAKTFIDLDRVPKNTSQSEADRLRRLKKILLDKDSAVERLVTGRRVVSLVANFRTEESQKLLERWADQDKNNDLRDMAAGALQRMRAADKSP